MPQATINKSDTNDSPSLAPLEPHEIPLSKHISLKERFRRISKRTITIVISLTVFATVLATFLGNLGTIKDFFHHELPPPSVPPITVKLTNKTSKDIGVILRGDFYLWLPGSGAIHTIGKYEFRSLGKNFPEAQQIVVKASMTVTVLAHVLNQKLYGLILEQGECDICLYVHLVNGGSIFTGDIPFTKEALNKYYVPVDLGVKQ
jgi:hypothetical protein